MSGDQPAKRRQQQGAANPKRKGGGGGGNKRRKGRGRKKANKSAIDPKRPLWENPAAEAEVRQIVGSLHPAHHPSAVVRSLGDPPLGKFGSNAPHYYDAVYEKAQHFAVAIAKANGLQVIEEEEPDPT